MHNISSDTINCECCRNNPKAKVSPRIMNIINSSLDKRDKIEQYWICKNYKGIVPKLFQQFRDERFRQQELGNKPMQLVLKNLIMVVMDYLEANFLRMAIIE
jgi:DNA polymerase I